MTSQSVVDKQRLVFGDTVEYKWVVKNCAKYGFIIRFTEGTDGITGISHELGIYVMLVKMWLKKL